MGVEIVLNAVVGKLETIDELLANGYGAVFIGSGAGPQLHEHTRREPRRRLLGQRIPYAGEPHEGVSVPGIRHPVLRGRKVVVIGGGNTAMDSARTALRLCPEEVSIVYRRSREELPARVEEVHHGEEEGLKFQLLTNPKRGSSATRTGG